MSIYGSHDVAEYSFILLKLYLLQFNSGGLTVLLDIGCGQRELIMMILIELVMNKCLSIVVR
jgi:hypothetical protein